MSVVLEPSRWQWKARFVPGHLAGVQSAETWSQVLLISLKLINVQIICSSEEVSMLPFAATLHLNLNHSSTGNVQ